MTTAPKIIPAEHLEACTNHANTWAHPIPLAWNLMLEAGLRLQEARNLAWYDLLHGHKAKTKLELTATMTKGNRARDVPVSRTLDIAIRQALNQRPHHDDWAPAHYALAPKCNHDALCPRSIQRAVKAIGLRVASINITPHTLRHTFATRLLNVSDMRTVQLALGHTRITTTEIYTHVNGDQLTEAIHRLDPKP
jgi:integrase/recombinase XerC